MHVAHALTEERLGGYVELVDFTSHIAFEQNCDAALEATCATLTVLARTHDVLRARGAVSSLRITRSRLRLIPAVSSQAFRGEPLTIQGDGSQTRSFTFVADLIEGIWRLARSQEHEPVNIGNPHEMTIRQFAEEILSLIDTPSQMVFTPLPTDDPKQRRPDISKARRVLNWEPQVAFPEGIRHTLTYFRDTLGDAARYPVRS
jgi:nucleoside-diphosphate-sugar epimerase